MGSSYVGNAATFLIGVVFGFLVLTTLLRFLLALVRADFYNPISQFVVKVTNWAVVPLRRMIPPLGKIDSATLVLLLGLQVIELTLTLAVLGGGFEPLGVVVWAVGELLSLTIMVFVVTIIVEVILSWVNPHAYNPVTDVLYALNAPLLAPARRMVPPISGLDLSPLLVLVALQLVKMLLVAPIRDLGMGLAGVLGA
jgi:YggT family protein